MSFPGYADYRDVEAEWLPRLPTQWRLASLRWLSRRFSGGTPDKNSPEYWENGTIPWINSGEVNQGLITVPSTFISDAGFAKSSAKWIPAGALVMALAGQGRTKGIVAQLAFPATCNQSMAAIVPRAEMNARFLYWWLQSNYQNIRNMAGGDLRDGLNLDLLGEIPCPLPSTAEQSGIAAFLDRETAKIDALVEEQKRLIELLKEKRQAVISQAVTKGLDPSVPMKDSGVAWLGEVPAHWELKRLKHLGEAVIGLTYSPNDVVDESEGSLVLRSSNVQGGEIVFDDDVYVSSVIPEQLITRVGDILICSRNGSRALVGKNAAIDERSVGLTFGAFMTIFRGEHNAYVSCILNSPLFEFQSSVFLTATINQLTVGVLKNFEVPFPPADERERIAVFISQKRAEFNALIRAAECAIDLLNERRSALISAAVTGKIDVRGVAPH